MNRGKPIFSYAREADGRRSLVVGALIAAIALLPSILSGVAWAGDAAARRVIGFSPDGRYFAFEQYWGVYEEPEAIAEIQVIDATTGRPMPGTPVRADVTGDADMSVGIEKARKQASAKAARLLRRLAIADPGPGFKANAIPLDEAGYYNMIPKEFSTDMSLRLPDGRGARLSLGPRPLGTEVCGVSKIEAAVAGFALTLTAASGEARILHDDKSLPKERRCAETYGLAEAYPRATQDGRTTLAVLLQFVDGEDAFEGPDRRFMAIVAILK